MRHLISLIAPDNSIRQNLEVERLRSELLDFSSGFSEYKGFGRWKDSDGNLHSESHARFDVAVDDANVSFSVIECLRRYAVRAGEQAIFYTLDGHGFIEEARDFQRA